MADVKMKCLVLFTKSLRWDVHSKLQCIAYRVTGVHVLVSAVVLIFTAVFVVSLTVCIPAKISFSKMLRL